MGRDAELADQNSKMIHDTVDDGAVHFGVYDRETTEMIGTSRISFWADHNTLPEEDRFKFAEHVEQTGGHMALLSKSMVLKDYRGSIAFLELCRAQYRVLLFRSVKLVFIATADHLVKTFVRLGFHLSGDRTVKPDYGSSNAMTFEPQNFEHLFEIRSPLCGVAADFRKSSGDLSKIPCSLNCALGTSVMSGDLKLSQLALKRTSPKKVFVGT